jgi:hypothetical protein
MFFQAGLMAVSKEAPPLPPPPPPPPALVVRPAPLPTPSLSLSSPPPTPTDSLPVDIVVNNTRVVSQPTYAVPTTIDFDLDLLADSLEDDDLEDSLSSVLFYWSLFTQKAL